MLTTTAIGADANPAGADSGTFRITHAKLYIPVVTLSTEDNAKLAKQLSEGFKRPVYWNKYKITGNKVVETTTAANEEKHIKELLDSSYQAAKRLFVLAYDNTASKQKALDADPRASQQIILTGKIKSTAEGGNRVIIYYILEQSKETMLEFYKGTAKIL